MAPAPADNPGANVLQAVLGTPSLKSGKISTLAPDQTYDDFIRAIIMQSPNDNSSFYVLDLGTVASLFQRWIRILPNVRPYYAVKCNTNPSLLATLAVMGAGFDCASPAEIDAVLRLGVAADRIVYANPCKPHSHIERAARSGVCLTTFDTVVEIEKLRNLNPNTSVLLRIKVPDNGARCPLGAKYGALTEEFDSLLIAANAAGIKVVGVSFHVGSGAINPDTFANSISTAKSVFDLAEKLGMPRMRVLDIGGGFTANSTFEIFADVVKKEIAEQFKDHNDLFVIAEPGRFMAETAFTLVTNVIGKRVRGDLREYWINDGIYGSMNCLLYDHATLSARPLMSFSRQKQSPSAETMTYESTVFGPTCDALDTVLRGYSLPELEVGDWLIFPNMGAYTTCAASNFNGFSLDDVVTHLAYSIPSKS